MTYKIKILIFLIISVLLVWFTLSLMGCKPDPVEPVVVDEYVDVTIDDGLKLEIGTGTWGRIAEVVNWNFVDDVDPNMEVAVHFTAGSGSTGQNLSDTVIYSALPSTTFRVKVGTYAQVWIVPVEEGVLERSGNFMFSASKSNVLFNKDNTSATLVASTDWHIVIMPVEEDGVLQSPYWTDTFTLDGVDKQCMYYYASKWTTEICAIPNDNPTVPICETRQPRSGEIVIVRIGIGGNIIVDYTNVMFGS
jgi:hypothetical protein